MSFGISSIPFVALLVWACSSSLGCGRRMHVRNSLPRRFAHEFNNHRVRDSSMLLDSADSAKTSRGQFVRGVVGATTLLQAQKASAKSRDDDTYSVRKTRGGWKNTLTEYEYFVLREGGTEPPFTSPLAKEKREGDYYCSACENVLFSSADKFDSGTGWPSFARPATDNGVEEVGGAPLIAAALNPFGTECRCSLCGGHLGDLFYDGFLFPGTEASKTFKRYCIDGTSLSFAPRGGGERVKGEAIIDPVEPPKLPSWLEPPVPKQIG